MLGGHAADGAALADLLRLVFQYDAREIISRVESHVVLSRYAARNVVRQVALMLWMECADVGKIQGDCHGDEEGMELRGRELFHPFGWLGGRAGEGELDRVILLLDEAAALSFAVPVNPLGLGF